MSLSLWWVLPFAGLLLSIALCPLMVPHFWHRHYGKVAFFWAMLFLLPYVLVYGVGVAAHDLAHVFFLEYLPFVILLSSLYAVAGGIHIGGRLAPSPRLNTGMLAFGTMIASWTGTTGAAMVLIRPLLEINKGRRHNVHVVVFFIFLVANIGGALTPLGDPPLFLGFLQGVDFFWTTQALFAPMLFLSVTLLVIFFALDSYFFKKEGIKFAAHKEPQGTRRFFTVSGIFNIVLLFGVVMAVLASGALELGELHVMAIHIPIAGVMRDALLLMILFLSMRFTSADIRRDNAFDWFPMLEVGKLFAGIFVTIIPAIALLRLHAPEMQAELSSPAMVFWLTGILSSVLDNAPTYLVFFHAFGGDAGHLMGAGYPFLLAISCGAVFMGALSYIGNAPNFMVRAIAEHRGVKMPSFFAYSAWASLILMPLFALVTWIWFV